MISDVLYKIYFDGALLRCLNQDETTTTLEKAHDGVCGGHFDAKALHTKLLRIVYFWPTMEEDCKSHVNTCLEC